jgi:hypothetical protein
MATGKTERLRYGEPMARAKKPKKPAKPTKPRSNKPAKPKKPAPEMGIGDFMREQFEKRG